jgi:hypothetical protein
MGRKAFVKDLEDAASVGRFVNIKDVRAGTDDGTVSFAFLSAALPTGVVMIEALVPGTCTFTFCTFTVMTDFLQRFLNTQVITCTSSTPLAVPKMYLPSSAPP